jgi:tetratricopeptide (TPR) repeat protein
MIQELESLPALPVSKKGKSSQFIYILAVSLLNLSGLGLGYLFMGRWLRWRIHFLVTLAMVLGVYGTKAYQYPGVWSLVFCFWLLWMVMDGGIQAWRARERTPSRLFKLILTLTLAVVVFFAESMGYFYYNLSALYSYQYGLAAYQSGDCDNANLNFQQLQKWSRLAISVNIKNAEDRIAECRLLLHAENAYQYGIYDEAISTADQYLAQYPDSSNSSLASDAAANSYHALGIKAQEQGEYETALKSYQIALERYPQSTRELGLREDIAALYLLQGDQLSEKGELEQAAMLYQEILDKYPETQTASQTAVKAAAAYSSWGDQLYEKGDHIKAMEKYQIVLNDFSWVTTVQPSVEKITTGLTEWGDQLLSQGDYTQAIEKYQVLLNKYKSTISPQMIRYKIAEMYYQWAKDLRQKKDYEGAFNKYGVITTYYSETPIAERAKIEVPQTYFGWVAELQDNDKYEMALEKLNLVIIGFDDETIKQKGREGILDNTILWGKYFFREKQYIEALEKYSTIIGDQTIAKVYLERADAAYQEALTALANDTQGQGYDVFSLVYRNACEGKPSPSPAIDLARDETGKALVCPDNKFNLPVDLWATKLVDFRYVIKAVYDSQEVERCEYSSSYTLIRKRHFVDVTVISTKSGEVVAGNRFYGSFPENCTGKFFFTENEQTIYGSADFGYEDWFRKLSTYTAVKL